MKDFLFLTFIFLIGISKAQACNFMGPTNFAFSASVEEGRGAFFDPEDNRVIEPSFLLTGCSSTKRKYLQLSLGAIEDFINNGSNITGINEDFEPASCQILNSPFKNTMKKEEIVKNFLQKRTYLNSCFDIFVTSANGQKIEFPEQEFCKFEAAGENNFKLKGSICYLTIKERSAFVFDVKAKEECLNKKYFIDNKIELQDLLANIGFNVTNSSDGSGKNMITVGSSTVRMSHDPLANIMSVSDDYGRVAPLFPGVWAIPNVHAGAVKVIHNGDYKEISIDLLADNRCKKICNEEGLCSSPCNYSSPVAAEVELYEVPKLPVVIEEDEDDDFFDDFDDLKVLKAGRTFVDSWYTGGVAQANWQGLIPGNVMKLKSEYLPVGKRYEAVITFRGPKLDYQFLMKKYRSLLPPLPDFASLASGVPMEISGVVTNLDSISNAMSSGGSIKEALKKLHSLFSYTAWPIFVDKVCNADMTRCKKPERKDNLRLTVAFDLEEDFFQMTNEYKIANIFVKRQSPVLDTVQEKREKQPKVYCEIE